MKALLTFCALLLWPLGTPQQSYKDMSGRLDEAEQLAAADGQESAAVQMARILERAGELTDRKERRQLEKRAAKALKKCDKDHASAKRAKESAAKRLLTLARKYDKLDWHDSVRQFAVLANELHAGSADKVLAKLPPPPGPKSMDAKALLQAGPGHPKDEPWSLLSGDLRSGDLAANAETWLLFADAPTRDWKLQCQVHPGTDGGQVGILFAHRGTKAFHRLRIDTDGKSLGMQLEVQDGRSLRTLYLVRIAVKRSELDDGIPLTLGMTGPQLTIELGNLQPRVFVLSLESTVGKLGLWGTNTGKSSFRAIFTKLEVSR